MAKANSMAFRVEFDGTHPLRASRTPDELPTVESCAESPFMKSPPAPYPPRGQRSMPACADRSLADRMDLSPPQNKRSPWSQETKRSSAVSVCGKKFVEKTSEAARSRMLTAAWNVGRLIELRFSGSPTLEDVAQFERDSHACVVSCVARTKQPVVVCTDIRATQLFRPAVTDRLIQTMRGNNRMVERNGMLGNGSALMALQIVRLTNEAAGDHRRRIFEELEPLLDWLAASLTAEEQAGVRHFLAGHEMRGTGQETTTTVATGRDRRTPRPFPHSRSRLFPDSRPQGNAPSMAIELKVDVGRLSRGLRKRAKIGPRFE